MPAAAPPARILNTFLDIYRVAEVELIRELAASVKRGTATADQMAAATEGSRLRARVEGIARRLILAIATGGASMLLDAAIHGGRAAITDLVALLGGKGDDYASPINQGSLDNLARSLSDTLTPAHLSITRVIDDAYKQIIGRASVSTLTGTTTRRQSSQRALDEFAAQGITGFTDKRGRNWELSSYAEMAARAATARASVDAHTDRLKAQGVELVYVSDSPQECPLCRPYEGKVLTLGPSDGPETVETENVLTGAINRVKVFGSLEAARAAGFMHPNCTHSVSAYLHGATKLPQATENPEGHKARQQLRALERGIRKARRVEAAAMTPEAQRDAAAKVRAWQGRIRDHVKATGAKRQPQRERLMTGDAAKAGPITPGTPSTGAMAERLDLPATPAALPGPRTTLSLPAAPEPEPAPDPADAVRKLTDAELDEAMQAALEAEDMDRFDLLGEEADRRGAEQAAREARNAAARERRADAAAEREEQQAQHLAELIGAGWDEESAVEEAYGVSIEKQRRDNAIRMLHDQGYEGKGFVELARASFDDYVYRRYIDAEDATNGFMLNRAGESAGIDPHNLFRGPEARARKWASDELKQWWDDYGRPTFEQWQAELLDDNQAANRLRAARSDYLA